MSSLSPRWAFAEPSAEVESLAADFSSNFAISPTVARVLIRRGLREAGQIDAYLNPGLSALHPCESLLGLKAAVARIQTAISKKEKILLYGDYDVDGTSAIVILKTVLDLLGASVEAFVPHRILDGYGMKEDRIREAADRKSVV